MAIATSIIDPDYNVNVYLDTNILFDYVENQFPLLTRSIDFLVQCPFVYLRSSHYVLFEFTENRKIKLFWEKADPTKSEEYSKVKYKIKQSWKYKDKEYSDFREDITKQIEAELNLFREQLDINFDEHVLHEGLVYPTNSLCLQTKISKEDCLVMVSCMNPFEDVKLEHCLLLTRDEQYYKAYNENTVESDKVFNDNGLQKPILIRTEELSLGRHSPQYNLYDNNGRTDIESYWVGLILNMLRTLRSKEYVGSTYEHGATEEATKCLYFEMDGPDKILNETTGLYFIYNDLTKAAILSGPFEFWNNEKVTLPHTNPDFPKYSFKAEGIDVELLSKLREDGNLVFYYNV